jgi:putative chitinase
MLSRNVLAQLYPRASAVHLDAFADNSDDLFNQFGIAKNETRLHFFLAQIGHESGGLSITEENLKYRAERIVEVWPSRFASVEEARSFANNPQKLANNVYSGRMGNGDSDSGDGWHFRGRGYIQITGRDGYRRVGQIAGLDLEASPDLAADSEHALLTTCAFWEWKRINEVCDTGDYVAVTRKINGGVNGMVDRRAWLDKVRRTFAEPPNEATQPPAQDVIAVQRALQAKGYKEIGAADGIIGPRTIAAITRFRQENGLPAGMIDRRLRVALGL